MSGPNRPEATASRVPGRERVSPENYTKSDETEVPS